MKQRRITKGIIYEGPSLLGNGEEIVVIAINNSKNAKTGGMLQTYILNTQQPPLMAIKSGLSATICGNCKHIGTSCYVRVEQAPTMIYKAYLRGSYPKLTEQETIDMFEQQHVRMGTYGDPAAINGHQWRIWLQKAKGNTGYTHQWRTTDIKDLCMASTDTNEEYYEAKSLGWRCFNVMNKNQQQPEGKSFICPASEAMGKKVQCHDCMACNGTQNGATADIMIEVHGLKHKVNKFKELTMIGV